MENIKKIELALKSNGFKLKEHDTSKYFGDYYYIYSRDSIDIKFSSDKSFKSIDVRLNKDGEDWFDLALVKALLYKESNLNVETTNYEYFVFLNNNINDIIDLFLEINYQNTKENIIEIKKEKLKQMFPNMK